MIFLCNTQSKCENIWLAESIWSSQWKMRLWNCNDKHFPFPRWIYKHDILVESKTHFNGTEYNVKTKRGYDITCKSVTTYHDLTPILLFMALHGSSRKVPAPLPSVHTRTLFVGSLFSNFPSFGSINFRSLFAHFPFSLSSIQIPICVFLSLECIFW